MAAKPRGAYLLEQQSGFYEAQPDSPEAALAHWQATKDERDRTYMAEARDGHDLAAHNPDDPGGYEAEAMAVVEAIASNAGAVRILNVANRSALSFLDDAAVVEVPCVVGAAGARPLAVGEVPEHARALVDTIKAVERATIEAALTGSTELAVKALALHPLVPSVTAAREIFAEYRQRLPVLEERFA
jgi:6-phospho-beta-glucosidase